MGGRSSATPRFGGLVMQAQFKPAESELIAVREHTADEIRHAQERARLLVLPEIIVVPVVTVKPKAKTGGRVCRVCGAPRCRIGPFAETA
jgi:hypothetical protein